MAIIEANAYLEDHCRLGIKSTLSGRHNFYLTRLLCKHLDSFTLPQFYPKYFPNISQPELQGLDPNK
ncbi:hypothetical protein [Nostoc sp. ChiSLP03a]|uniref:hypothetical protein n=1 Tax=Nostoc sp. ChiSLP03a TaxID=3075380 RepID=UPI002AD2872D|nr:hypothetical protein [Nostoc sp. ChiSLP03a]MDZ8210450.1 hypothetical protein [Nostoc sp. ChiSLP03a]